MMKRIITMCAAIAMTVACLAGHNTLTVKQITDGDMAAKTVSGMRPVPGTSLFARISANGRKITTYSFKTGKVTGVLFDADKAAGCHVDNIDGYIMSPNGKTMLIQTATKPIYRRSFLAVYYIYNVSNKSLRLLSTDSLVQIPTFSPDGQMVAFVRDNNIFITDFKTEKQITNDGKRNSIINGLPDWVNEEEFGFNNALAWGQDSHTLSWIRYDESKVKSYSLQLYKGLKPERKDFATYPGLYSYKYPKAGEDNSKVTAWSYDVTSGKTTKYALPIDSDGYIPRIKSFDGGIMLYTMNRHQNLLRLYKANPQTGECRLLIEEKGDKYVKEEAIEGIMFTANNIIMPSDRDGYMHLYLYNRDGKLLRQVERGNYDVTAIYGMDSKGNVYYQAATPNPWERSIWMAEPSGRTKRLTEGTGWNSAEFSADYKYFLRIWSDRNTPYVYTVADNNGRTVRTLEDNHELREKWNELVLPSKELFSLTTKDGVQLNGWMMKPADFDPHKRYPVILHQYSGPGSQQVVDSWAIGSMGQGGAYDAYLTQQGFIVVCVDGRGTGGRGSAFEKTTYMHIGKLESHDQVEVALWLGQQSYVDSTRIGIWGWSYGGFNTLMSMSEGRPVFRCGVAIAPPTDWRFYDTIYTERYMRTPRENPDGYDINPIKRAAQLNGRLLICHGTADDNVHPQNTYEYAEALVQADKDFHENYYTNRNHSIRGGNSRNHLLRQVAEWFVENMK